MDPSPPAQSLHRGEPGAPLLVYSRASWRGAARLAIVTVGVPIPLAMLYAGGVALSDGEGFASTAEGGAAVVIIVSGLLALFGAGYYLVGMYHRRPRRVQLRLDALGVVREPTGEFRRPRLALPWSRVHACWLFTRQVRRYDTDDFIAFCPAPGSEKPTWADANDAWLVLVDPLALRYALRIIPSWNVSPEEVVRVARHFSPGLRVIDKRK